MPYVSTTTVTPEQQFEAEVRAAVLKAIPWLPASSLEHQTSFTFKAGHNEITVNGEPRVRVGARLDVLVRHKGEPLAILELKRKGEKLNKADEAQAVSYARLVSPMAPLAVLTNGTDVRFFNTFSGERWQPVDPDEVQLKALIENAATVAASDLKAAIQTLMAGEPDVWMSAVRQVSDETFAEMTGDWGDPTATFFDGWGFSRRATHTVISHLKAGARLVTVEGPPLAGKSHVLRDLSQDLKKDDQFAILYVQADGGADIFQMIADILSISLGWPLTQDEARHWLQMRARAKGPALVLALDHVGRGDADQRRDIEALTSNLFGPGVRVVVAADDGAAEALMTKANGRGASQLATRATRVDVGGLDEQEFGYAIEQLDEDRITFLPGARYSVDLRYPWVLKAIINDIIEAKQRKDPSLAAALSPVPGLHLILKAREHFDTDGTVYGYYRAVAKAVLADLETAHSVEHQLELLAGYVVRRDTLNAHLASPDVLALETADLISPRRGADGEAYYAVRLPQLLASELAQLVADQLTQAKSADATATVDQLLEVSGGLFMGATIAAQAIVDAATRKGFLSGELIVLLADRPPVKEVLPAGAKVGAHMEGAGMVTITLLEGGAMKFEAGGRTLVTPPEPGGPQEHVAWRDHLPWLILSYLARRPFIFAKGEEVLGRVDTALALLVGACPTVLVEPGGDIDIRSLPTHLLSESQTVLCHSAGLAEPITASLFDLLARDWRNFGDEFVEEALSLSAPGLLARLDIALRALSSLQGDERKAWVAQWQPEVSSALDAVYEAAGLTHKHS